MMTVQEKIRQVGWRQGDIIIGPGVELILNSNVDYRPCHGYEPNVLLLLSQDCDLVTDQLEKEPYAEFLAGCSIENCKIPFQKGRNPRLLHLSIGSRNIEFSIQNRFRVRKECLAEHGIRNAETSLPMADMRLVLRWFVKRYIRPAFPDAFNIRLGHKRKEQESLAKSELVKHVSIVLFDVSDEEYPPGRPYELQIIIGVSVDTPKEMYERIEREFESAFTVEGVVLKDIAVNDEDDITLRILRSYKRWDQDFRSHPESPAAALPPAGVDVL